jgi:hypothetical protein
MLMLKYLKLTFVYTGGMAFAALGIFISDKFEEQYPEQQRIESVPVVVDRS